jgi:hypothetical protein
MTTILDITTVTSAIDVTFPIAGQDNDTQGFRNNWAGLAIGLEVASRAVSDLQLSVDDISTRVNNTNIPVSSIGVSGDAPGQIASDGEYLYFCYAEYDGASDIWAKVATVSTSW